jgi:hypothetical protein
LPFPFSKKIGGAKKRKKRKGKIYVFVGSLQSFQNNKLKQVLLLTQYRLLFFHFFTNCGAMPVVN